MTLLSAVPLCGSFKPKWPQITVSQPGKGCQRDVLFPSRLKQSFCCKQKVLDSSSPASPTVDSQEGCSHFQQHSYATGILHFFFLFYFSSLCDSVELLLSYSSGFNLHNQDFTFIKSDIRSSGT